RPDVAVVPPCHRGRRVGIRCVAHSKTLPHVTRAGPCALAQVQRRRWTHMRPYEVMVIYEPGLEEDAVRAAVDRSTQFIRSKGGNPGRVDRWGKRRLAYEINHHREGYYVLMEANAEPDVMTELDRSLHLA